MQEQQYTVGVVESKSSTTEDFHITLNRVPDKGEAIKMYKIFDYYFDFGTLAVPYIVSIICISSFICCVAYKFVEKESLTEK